MSIHQFLKAFSLILQTALAATLISSGIELFSIQSEDLSKSSVLLEIYALHFMLITSIALFISPMLSAIFIKVPSWKSYLGILESEVQIRSFTKYLLSILTAILPFSAIIWLMAKIAHGFNQANLAALWMVLAGLLACLFCAFCFPMLILIYEAILQRLPTKILGLQISTILILSLILVCLLTAYQITTLPLEAYQMQGYYQLSFAMLLVFVCSIYLNTSNRFQFKPMIVLVLYFTLLCLSLWILSNWHVDKPAHTQLPKEGKLSAFSLKLLRKISDRDGDGFSAILGGGDCDDQQAQVSPDHKEIPNNGIDDNCRNGDLVKVIDEAKASEKDLKNPSLPPNTSALSSTITPSTPAQGLDISQAKKYNILFILVDTLRANHLGIYGYPKPTSIHLDQWAKNAFVFENAIAHAPRTPFSIPSILTGIYPSKLKWVDIKASYGKLTDENTLIFEYFKQAGWHTIANTAHWYFGADKAINLNQGVDLWDNEGALSIKDSNTQSEAELISTKLINTIKAQKDKQAPFFLFAHYFAPHSRYLRHASDCENEKADQCHVEPLCTQHPTQCKFGENDDHIVGTQDLIDKYDSEIAYVDLHLNRVFKALEANQLIENTIVVLTSDHGESFNDRKPKTLFHGTNLFQEELHVPLIIKLPTALKQELMLKEAGKIHHYVGLTDILPTLLSLTHIKLLQESSPFNGLSLLPILQKTEDTQQSTALLSSLIWSELLPYGSQQQKIISMLSRDGSKLMKDQSNQQYFYFDLKKDKKEKNNLYLKQKQAISAQIEQLEQYIENLE